MDDPWARYEARLARHRAVGATQMAVAFVDAVILAIGFAVAQGVPPLWLTTALSLSCVVALVGGEAVKRRGDQT